ncbi:MAG TPA: SLC13 family permease [Stellaceae bacterium]|nr:SLC13 family permease [Stellaceae bacterium]
MQDSAQAQRSSDYVEYARLLRQIDLFAGLDRVTLAKLASHLHPSSHPAGSIIFRQGDVADACFLVASGSVGVYTNDKIGMTDLQVKVLHAGEPFGEMALLNNIPRTATIKVETDCQVLRLDRSAFVELVRERPSVALAIAATLSRRLAGMLDRGQQTTDNVSDKAIGQATTAKAPATAGMARPRWRIGRLSISLLLALIIVGIGWAAPPPSGLTPVAWRAVIVLVAILPALVLDALLEGVLGFLLACGWVLFGVTSAAEALSGFATASWVLVVSVLIIGAGITQTGVLYRLSLITITYMRGGFVGEATALVCAGQLMGPAVPNATSRIIIIAPMLRELVGAMGYAMKSKAAAGLAMAVLIGFGQMAATTLTSATTSVLVAAVLPVEARSDINWITWTLYGAPFNLILLVGMLGTIVWHYRPSADDRLPSGERKKSLALQHALLGAMSRDEKIALWVGIALLAGFITQPLHRVDPGWVAAIAVGVLSATRVVNVNTLRMVNWNFALLFGILISLATVFNHTGLDRWVANRVAGAIGDLSSSRITFVVVLSLLCFAISFVVRWQAAAPLVTIALAPIASHSGIHPYIVGLVATIACTASSCLIKARHTLRSTLAPGRGFSRTRKRCRRRLRLASGR